MPSLDFKGKAFVYAHHLTVPFRELVPDAKKSCLPKSTVPALDGNLIIHGDNLHALKALLPLYAGKVDCVIIDPPYNTGNEGWCYNDNVRSPIAKEWLKKASPVDREDLERHDKWACMMWPRLKLLHELLAEDGVIFISIDDNEIHRLRALMDEIFGTDSLLAEFVWKSRVSEDTRSLTGISNDHEYILCYAKSDSLRLAGVEKEGTKFDHADGDKRGPWRSADITGLATKDQRPNLHYDLIDPDTAINYGCPPKGWRYGKDSMAIRITEKRILWPKEPTGRPRLKLFEKEIGNRLKNISTVITSPSTRDGTKELNDIMGFGAFDFPKPSLLIEALLTQAAGKDALILDSFGGSGTTAHAVLAQNKKDGGKRRFILVECEDYADTLTAERVRRVIRGYPFTGTKRTELMREPLNWTKLKKADALVEKAESIKQLEGASYDEVKITVEAGELVVTGEMTIKDKAPGIPGAFTYCTLGAEMSLEGLLTGKDLPAFEALAKYVFYTATGRTLATVAKQPAKGGDGFIGEAEHYRVHLLYQPDQAWLRSEAAVLTETKVEAIVTGRPTGQRSLVFAAAKYLSQKDLTGRGVEFCQLPYAIHRILGESATPRA